MLAAERRDLLLERLARDGKIVAKELAAELGLSEDSVRRDLRELAAAGLCQRVYGGALPASPALADYRSRGQVEPDSKRRVATAALELVETCRTVILDGGTTTLAVAQRLPDRPLTVITHSPTIAVALLEKPQIEVLLIGGRLFRHSAVTCGAAAVEAAQAYSAELFLLGVTGVHPTAGFTTGDAEEAAMKRALSARAAETWVLGSAEKIGAASPFRVLTTSEVTGVVTDAAPEDGTVRELRTAGLQVLQA